MTEQTLLSRFVVEKVCGYPSLLVPLTPALVIGNIFDFYTFFTLWSILVFVFLIIWLIVPCNPNINCTPDTKKKDGTKAFLVSFLILYALLLVVAITGKLFLCGPIKSEGSVLENVRSLFTLRENNSVKDF
jgi:hypothetical protein